MAATGSTNTLKHPDLQTGPFRIRSLKSNVSVVMIGRKETIDQLTARVHSGRMTQVWDATVTDEISEKTIALFRCTQLILYPR